MYAVILTPFCDVGPLAFPSGSGMRSHSLGNDDAPMGSWRSVFV